MKNTQNITYTQYRCELVKSGEKKSRKFFDARKAGALKEARAFAESKVADGYKVTLYRLDKIGDEWNREDIYEVDGRKPKKAASKKASPSSKKSTRNTLTIIDSTKKTAQKTARKPATVAPVAASDDINARLDRLEETVDKLAKSVEAICTIMKRGM